MNGEDCYLNDTDQYSRLGSSSYAGRMSIALSSQAYEVIRVAPDNRNRTDTTYTLSLDNSGKTQLGMTRRFYGGSYNSLNRYFSELPPEERKRYHQELVSGLAQGARPVGELTTQFNTYPGVERLTVEIDHYSVVDGKYTYFDLPFTPSLFPLGADRRTLPLFIGYESESTVRTEIELPAGFRKTAITPGNESWAEPNGAGTARITTTETDGKRVMTHEFAIFPAIVSAKDYAAMLKVEAALGKKSSKTFLLEASDVVP